MSPNTSGWHVIWEVRKWLFFRVASFFFFIFVFSIIQRVDKLVDDILPMTGLEPQISPFGSDRFTTTALRVATSKNKEDVWGAKDTKQDFNIKLSHIFDGEEL